MYFRLIRNACIASLMVIMLAVSAVAQEFKVGRVTINFAPSGWIAIEVPDKGVNYSGEISGTIPSETRIFLNQNKQGGVLALMVVSASKGGISDGYFTYSPVCEDKQSILAEGNKGIQQNFAECLMVFPLFTTSSLLNQLTDSESLILKSAKVQLPEAMQLIFSRYSTSNGTHMIAKIMLAPGFAGHPSITGQSTDPVFAWAREFMKGVKSGASSFRGRAEIPAIEFKQDNPEKKVAQINTEPSRRW